MENQNKFIVPGAIIIAGFIIAGAIFYGKKTPVNPAPLSNQNQPANIASSPLDNLKPVAENDHILGNPEALVVVVTFTDFECPFCKRFHLTMKQIMEEYGKTGKVKWVLRHLPLEQLHSKSKNEAIASECAAGLGGNEKFWQYVDRIFEITPGNDGLESNELPKIAEYVGLDKTKFSQCLTSGKFDQRVKENMEDGMQSGALGTPYSVVVGPNGEKSAIPGALPYSDVKNAIEEMLK